MITIKKSTQLLMSNRNEYQCPECEATDVFFRWAPKNCPVCNHELPDLFIFGHSENEMIKWHFAWDIT